MSNADFMYVYNRVADLGAIDVNRLPLLEEDDVPEDWKGWYKGKDTEDKIYAALYADLSHDEYDYVIMVLVTGWPVYSLCCTKNPVEYVICDKYGALLSLPCIVTATYKKGTREDPIYDYVPVEVADEALASLPIVGFDYTPFICAAIAIPIVLYGIHEFTR